MKRRTLLKALAAIPGLAFLKQETEADAAEMLPDESIVPIDSMPPLMSPHLVCIAQEDLNVCDIVEWTPSDREPWTARKATSLLPDRLIGVSQDKADKGQHVRVWTVGCR